MAFRHGSKAAFSLNAVALTTFLDNVDLSFDIETADTTMFGATFKSAVAGVPAATITLSGGYDPTATTGPAAAIWACIAGGVPVTGLYHPGGNVAGQALWTITSGCLVTGYGETSPVGGRVNFTANILVTVLPVRTVV